MRGVSEDNSRRPCSEIPQLNLQHWQEKPDEENAVRVAIESGSKKVKVIRTSSPRQWRTIAGQVTAGKLIVGLQDKWDGSLPVGISLEDVLDSAVDWTGQVKVDSAGHGTLNSSFFSGFLTGKLEVSFESPCENISVDGSFFSAVHFESEQKYNHLKNRSFRTISPRFPVSSVTFDEEQAAPLVLLGTYSEYHKFFLWSGDFQLQLPEQQTPSIKMAYTPPYPERKLPLELQLEGGTIWAQGIQIWNSSFPVSIPVPHFFRVLSFSSSYVPETSILVGKFSIPQVVLNGEISSTGISGPPQRWYNGHFSFHMRFLSNEQFKTEMNSSRTMSVYLKQEKQHDHKEKKASSLVSPELSAKYSATPQVTPEQDKSSLVLLGTFTEDDMFFRWSGHAVLIVPEK